MRISRLVRHVFGFGAYSRTPSPDILIKYSSVVALVCIEIINNTRVDIEGKIWERGYWGANSSPGCSLIHDVPGKKVILDEFFCFFKCFSS